MRLEAACLCTACNSDLCCRWKTRQWKSKFNLLSHFNLWGGS